MRLQLRDDIFEYDQSMNPIDLCAEKLNVRLTDRHPKIELDSYDFVRMLRFNVSKLGHPRVAIAPGAAQAAKMWDKDKWIQLCTILENKVNASIIQLGDEGERFFGFGKDIIGKVTAREKAVIISQCDLLVSVDNGYAHLAAAVETPCVVMFEHDRPSYERSESSLAIFAGDSSGAEGSIGCMQDISLASVIDGIVNLCGNEQ
jgi:ADP-heptose:LPS heptosyltransferase